MDGTYTAFVVPIGVGFNTSSVQWNWVGYWDFIAGNVLWDNATCAVKQSAFQILDIYSSGAALKSTALLHLHLHMPCTRT